MNPTADLFADLAECAPQELELRPGAVLLRGFALAHAVQLLRHVDAIIERAPYRHMSTPAGFRMSVAMSNCGALGWITDRKGYRYAGIDPHSGAPWPAMPALFAQLAHRAAERAGFSSFAADACLINRYEPGARMSLHQDKDETDLGEPIVSVSLGLPAMFLFGGSSRSERPTRVSLMHGDVVVWGGAARLAYHGVLPMAAGEHPVTGACRINLTLRRAG